MKRRENKRMTFANPSFGTTSESNRINGLQQSVSEPEFGNATIKKRIKQALLVVGVIILVALGVFGWEFYSAAANLTGQHNPIKLFQKLFPQSLAETRGRVNILLAGYSVGDPNHPGAQLTDSIMIVSINPKNKTGTIISVPRDMWVNIPGYGYNKINAAYEYGQVNHFNEQGYFPGGMGLLERVVSHDFGANFNYYALINYAAFKDAVNAVGGINITIHSSDPRGIYDAYTNLKLANGKVTLNGQEALNLARARGDTAAGDISYGLPNSDFTRTRHQQQMLVALKDKASQLSSLIDPLTIIRLVKSVGDNVKTDLNIGQMETLYNDTKAISNNNIKQVTINNYNGNNLLSNYYVDGQDALVPAAGTYDYSQIKNAVNTLLYGP